MSAGRPGRGSSREQPSLEERVNAWVERNLAAAPPLTSEAADLIKRLMGPTAEKAKRGVA